MRTLLVSAVVAIAVAGTSGCGDGTGGLPRADLMIDNASAALRSVQTAHLDLDITGKSLVRAVSVDVQQRPPVAQGVVTLASGSKVSFLSRDGHTYTRQPDGRYKLAPSGSPDVSSLLDPKSGVSSVIASVEYPYTVVKEPLDGEDTFRVVGTIPPGRIPALIPGAAQGGTLTVWLRARWPHIALRSEVDTPAATTAIRMTNLNEPIHFDSPAVQ